VLDEEMGSAMKITVIATGFRGQVASFAPPAEPRIVRLPQAEPAAVPAPEPVEAPPAPPPAPIASSTNWDEIPASPPALHQEETLADVAQSYTPRAEGGDEDLDVPAFLRRRPQ
jgi:hypothetical protein